MDHFDNTHNIIDDYIPKNTCLSGCYKKCSAYKSLRRPNSTIRDVLEHLSINQKLILRTNPGASLGDIENIEEQLLQLQNELDTNEKLYEFKSARTDNKVWQDFIKKLPIGANTFFSACWVYTQCYLYRRINLCFEASEILKSYDYFKKKKEDALINSTEAIEIILNKTRRMDRKDTVNILFEKLLKLNLWGNLCDLAYQLTKNTIPNGDQLALLNELNEFLVIDNIKPIFNCISQVYTRERIIDFVNDNAGYELFTDFILAEFLIDYKFATKIRFHVKAIPWFVSDATPEDFKWTINYLQSHESQILCEVGKKWSQYVKTGQFELSMLHYFWTSPYKFTKMNTIDNDLYKKLSMAHLIIFKGDLNYRKLIGDRSWDVTVPFEKCIKHFTPTNLCTLRVIKCEALCGVPECIIKSLNEKDPSWLLAGKYGIIDFYEKKV